MEGNLGVSLEVLKTTARIIREQKELMGSKLSSISSSVSGLRRSYDSPAAQNLEGIASNMSERFAELKKEVEGFAKLLDEITGNYEVNENSAEEMLSKVLEGFKR